MDKLDAATAFARMEKRLGLRAFSTTDAARVLAEPVMTVLIDTEGWIIHDVGVIWLGSRLWLW